MFYPVFIARFYKGLESSVLWQVGHYHYQFGDSFFDGNCEDIILSLNDKGWKVK